MLSIIIPVYRVEDTLDRCIESILCQMDDNHNTIGGWDWEILLIDDGSPDTCPQICNRWADSNSHIKVYHKQNGGLSDARNYGIDRAKGDWITFVDSDDELEEGTLASLINIIAEKDDCDILEYPVLVCKGSKDEHTLVLPEMKWKSAREYWHSTEGWEHCYACNKLFRKEFLGETRFAVGRVFEDSWFYPELLKREPRITTTNKGLYIYKWNENGITAQNAGGNLYQLLEANIRAQKIMRTSPFSKNGWKLYRSMLYRQIDVYRLTGKMLLHWPFVKFVCRVHKTIIHR